MHGYYLIPKVRQGAQFPQGQITEITVRPGGNVNLRQRQKLGEREAAGVGCRGVLPSVPLSAQRGVPALPGTWRWHSLGVQKG